MYYYNIKNGSATGAEPFSMYTPGQGILPRDHGHLFYRKPVGVFVSLI